jgi:acyl-CoA dehydrogenase
MVAAEAAACGVLPISAAHSGLAEVSAKLAQTVPPAAQGLLAFARGPHAVRDLAARIFDDRVTVERIKAIEASDDRIDRDLWRELGKAHLLGIAVDDVYGGSGLGLTALCMLLREQGRTLAPVPLLTLTLGASALETFGTADTISEWLPLIIEGDAIVTAALSEPGNLEAAAPRTTATRDGRITGTKLVVTAGNLADRVLVPAMTPDGVTVFLVNPRAPGALVEPLDTTDRQANATIQFADAAAEAVVGKPGDGAAVVRHILDRAHVGLAALQLGVCAEALRRTAEYTSERVQFGKPLSTFQGVALRAADAYIDSQAMEVTMLQAAWRLDHGLDAAKEVAVAKWFANVLGQQVSDLAMQLHGGSGYSEEYGIERLHRDSHGWAIAGGTPAIQRVRITSELLGRPFNQRRPEAIPQ